MIKLALPAGDLRAPVAEVLADAGLNVEGYGEGSRSYILSAGREDVVARVFRDKDIPIQIALGNYDIGVCGLAWLAELRARFPSQPIVPLRDLGVGRSGLFATAGDGVATLAELGGRPGVRVVSEYANLAEAFALSARLPGYRVQSVWGAAEAYPPEDADIAVISACDEDDVAARGLRPLARLLEGSAWLIANAHGLATKDLSPVLDPLGRDAGRASTPRLTLPGPLAIAKAAPPPTRRSGDRVRMALPDGHQQPHVVAALRAAGLLPASGYDENACERRPESPIGGLDIKVVRPHDMPQLVATGEMDIAITGRDCVREHLSHFPSSPIEEAVDLQRSQYNLAAVVSEDVPADDLAGAMAHWRSQGRSVIRIASEFLGIADAYARSRHIGRYQVIPIAGASEGFVPEDAEILVEGTETGKTLRVNRLKAIDTIFRSTSCVLVGKGRTLSAKQRPVFERVLGALRDSVGSPHTV